MTPKSCLNCACEDKPLEPYSGLCVDCLAKASAAARLIEQAKEPLPFDPKMAQANDQEDA